MSPRSPGRPKAPLRPAKATVTRRVRLLVDQIHDSNLNEASEATGVPYATLRDLYNGRTTRPGEGTLTKLAQAYGFWPHWFTEEKEPDQLPQAGNVWNVRERSASGRERGRGIVVPYAAFPLPTVRRELLAAIAAQPAKPGRILVGEITESHEIDLRVCEFLLGPLLSAEEAGLIPPLAEIVPIDRGRNAFSAEAIRLFSQLGRYWRSVLIGDKTRTL